MNRKVNLIEDIIRSNNKDNFTIYCKRNCVLLRQSLKQYRESFNLYKQEIEDEEIQQEILLITSVCYNNNKEDGYLMQSIENRRVDLIRYFSAKKRNIDTYQFGKIEEDNMYKDVDKNMLVKGLIEGLSKYERGVFIARTIYDLSFEQIGNYVGKTRQTVSKDYKRIQAKLRKEIGE